jgi:hypothetical protein
MNEYPSVIVTSNDKNIRFGAMPIRADIQGLKQEGKIPFSETARPSYARPNYFFERQFSDIFWKKLQSKNLLTALAIGGGQNAFLSTPTNLMEAMNAVNELNACGEYISNVNRSAKAITAATGGGFSNRIFKSTVYLKEAYLNTNKKSVILGDRVLIRDKFLTNEKTKKVIKQTYYNGVLVGKFSESVGSNKVTFVPTNNHMVAGGPLFQTNAFSTIKGTNKTAYLNSIKKIFKDDLEKLNNNPTLDPSIINKRKQEQETYLSNLEKNIGYNSSSVIISDFSDFITSKINAKEPYYKGKKNSILGEQIKYGKNLTAYWPAIYAQIGDARTTFLAGDYDVPGGILIDGAYVTMSTQPLGRLECFYPYLDNYYIVNGETSTAYIEQYAPTPVYSTKSVVAGYTVSKK